MKSESNKELYEPEIEEILNSNKAGLRRFQFGLRQFMLVWITSGVVVGAGGTIFRVLKKNRDVDVHGHFIGQYASFLILMAAMIWFCTIVFAIAILIKTRFDKEQRKKLLRSLAIIYLAGLLVTFTPPIILLSFLYLSDSM